MKKNGITFAASTIGLVVVFLFSLSLSCEGQVAMSNTLDSLTGSYKSPVTDSNKFSSESIELRSDSTFEYVFNTEFFRIKASGYWIVTNGRLYLNSKTKSSKIAVKESRFKGHKTKFQAIYSDSSYFHYHLHVISKTDTFYIKDVFYDTVIRTSPIRAFFIVDSRGMKYPTYFVKKGKSRCFRIFLSKERIFDNEAWEINAIGIQPIGLDGTAMKYHLVKDVLK